MAVVYIAFALAQIVPVQTLHMFGFKLNMGGIP